MSVSVLPSTRRAIAQDKNGNPQLVEGIPMPALHPGTMLIKTSALAINPSDYKMYAAFPTPGAVVGNDFSGTVVAVAGDITDFKPGDIVCGGVNCSNPDFPKDGAFSEYIRIPRGLAFRPTNLDFEKAAQSHAYEDLP